MCQVHVYITWMSVLLTPLGKKILCSKKDTARLFQITPEGDGKMNVHISVA